MRYRECRSREMPSSSRLSSCSRRPAELSRWIPAVNGRAGRVSAVRASPALPRVLLRPAAVVPVSHRAERMAVDHDWHRPALARTIPSESTASRLTLILLTTLGGFVMSRPWLGARRAFRCDGLRGSGPCDAVRSPWRLHGTRPPALFVFVADRDGLRRWSHPPVLCDAPFDRCRHSRCSSVPVRPCLPGRRALLPLPLGGEHRQLRSAAAQRFRAAAAGLRPFLLAVCAVVSRVSFLRLVADAGRSSQGSRGVR